MKKRIKGFTLVELIAVIVILSIILIIGVPSLVSNIKAQKSKASGYVCDIIKAAAKNYGVDYGIEGRQSISISDLCERYISCPIIDPNTNEEIEGYLLINDDECNFLSTVKLDVTLNGGTPAQSFVGRYGQYYTLRLLPPTKEKNDFVEWIVVRGNSTIDDNNILKFGDTDTEIFAVWESWPTLTLDLDGGTIGNNFGGIYKSGTIIETTAPTKEGYVFAGWDVVNENESGIISGNTFTMGSVDTTLKALWAPASLINSYSCANVNGGEEPYSFTYTGNCEIIDDGDDNWRVKFLTSGTFVSRFSTNIDVFLVGGGGGGGHSGESGGGGGGGGYTLTEKEVNIIGGKNYPITIGDGGGVKQAGGTTSAFDFNALGGAGGARKGGSGGSGGGGGGFPPGGTGGVGNGGKGGSDGGNGGSGAGGSSAGKGGAGQGTTTREFGESTGDLYAGGGGGGAGRNAYEGEVNPCCGGAGGAGGGGRGGNKDSYINGGAGTTNTGGGGGGGRGYTYNGAVGGSGIVVIRNARG